MKILVKNKDLWGESITAQIIVDGEVWYCNHRGADYQKIRHEVMNQDRPDFVWYAYAWVCDKCQAVSYDDMHTWEEL